MNATQFDSRAPNVDGMGVDVPVADPLRRSVRAPGERILWVRSSQGHGIPSSLIQAVPFADEQHSHHAATQALWVSALLGLAREWHLTAEVPRAIAGPSVDTNAAGGAAPSSESVRWSQFLEQLPQSAEPLLREYAREISDIWWNLQVGMGAALTPPTVEPDDEGGVRLSWSTARDYVEIEVNHVAGGLGTEYSWFSADRQDGTTKGSAEPTRAKPVKELISALRELMSRAATK